MHSKPFHIRKSFYVTLNFSSNNVSSNYYTHYRYIIRIDMIKSVYKIITFLATDNFNGISFLYI